MTATATLQLRALRHRLSAKWWVVILLHLLVVWGAMSTHGRTFGGFKKYRVKNALAVVGIWLLVCFAYSLSPLWS